MNRETLLLAIASMLRELDGNDASSKPGASIQDSIIGASFTKEEWNTLVQLANEEGVAPLLYMFCLKAECKEIPDNYFQTLAQAYYATAASNSVLIDELTRILEVLGRVEIPVILLKGADLAHTLYPDVAMRPMADLDLLVPYACFEQVLHILEDQLGYHSQLIETALNIQRLVAYHRHLSGGPRGLVNVEVHWNLVSSEQSWYAVPVDWFWEHSQPINYPGIGESDGIRKLDLEANLLYLTSHAMLQHGVKQCLMIWLYDIHAFISAYKDSIDWKQLTDEAGKLGWSCVLAAGLRQSEKYFGTQLPEDLLVTLDVASEPQLANLVDFKSRFSGTRSIYDWYAMMSLRWPDRLRFASALLFPGREYILKRYQPKPNWLWFVYYPYRWMRVIWDTAQMLGKGLWRYNHH